MKLPAKITALRKAKKMSQAALAVAMRVSAPTISRWETGEDHPSGEHLRRLAEIFEVPLSALIDDALSVNEMRAEYRVGLQLPATIPVFGYGSAGEGLQMDDQGYPKGEGEFEIMRSGHNTDPHAYATRVKGNSMYPRFWDGDIVELRTDVEVTTGNLALVIHEDGTKWIKRVTIRRNVVRCEPLNPSEKAFEVPADKVRLHRIVSWRGEGT
jgi:phage repressor protein C with HTH and peptisase S24 domain